VFCHFHSHVSFWCLFKCLSSSFFFRSRARIEFLHERRRAKECVCVCLSNLELTPESKPIFLNTTPREREWVIFLITLIIAVRSLSPCRQIDLYMWKFTLHLVRSLVLLLLLLFILLPLLSHHGCVTEHEPEVNMLYFYPYYVLSRSLFRPL
jgi:hypothetical protein